MQSKIITTFPFLFPPRPWEMRMLSALRKGVDGRLGILIEPVIDRETVETTCSFFEIDVLRERVTQHVMTFSYRFLLQMDLCYDESRQVWIIVLRGNGSPGPLDIYEVSCNVGQPWTFLFAANSLDQKYRTDKHLVACWQHENAFPLLFSEADMALMHDDNLYWTHWRSSDLAQAAYQNLGTAYAWVPQFSDEGCLLVTCQCLYDAPPSDPVYAKKGSGQWCFIAQSFGLDGTLLRQTRLPQATFPVRHMEIASEDLFSWLDLSLYTAEGPRYGQQQRSYVVVAMMYDHTEEFTRLKQGFPAQQQQSDNSPQQGGVYCLDKQGQILSFQVESVGEHMSLCSCQEQVIGTMFKNGTWQVWRWFPFKGLPPDLSVTLPPYVERAFVVSPENQTEGNDAWFWCIEEYEHALRIVQRSCLDLREIQAVWCKGISVPTWFYSPGIREQRPQGIVAHQKSLFVLGLSKDRRLNLFRFQ